MLLLLAIYPVPLIWVLVLMLAAWRYMLYKYHEAHHDITEKVKESCYHAKVAAERSRQHMSAASEYDKQGLHMVKASNGMLDWHSLS
jgi:hypothetical protein